MADITLVYELNTTLYKALSPAQLATNIAAINVQQDELDFLGYTAFSDNTVSLPGLIRRTIVLQTNADSDSKFPTDAERIDSTRDLYKGVLSKRLPGIFSAADPAVTP